MLTPAKQVINMGLCGTKGSLSLGTSKNRSNLIELYSAIVNVAPLPKKCKKEKRLSYRGLLERETERG